MTTRDTARLIKALAIVSSIQDEHPTPTSKERNKIIYYLKNPFRPEAAKFLKKHTQHCKEYPSHVTFDVVETTYRLFDVVDLRKHEEKA